MRLYSIGYQGKSLRSLCSILSNNSIQLLIDVRSRAWSFRPEFRKNALKQALNEHGIDYTHLKIAGNPYRPPYNKPINPKLCESKYLKYLNQTPAILDTCYNLLSSKPSAIFCYESNRIQCHRNVLIRMIIAANPAISCIDL